MLTIGIFADDLTDMQMTWEICFVWMILQQRTSLLNCNGGENKTTASAAGVKMQTSGKKSKHLKAVGWVQVIRGNGQGEGRLEKGSGF